MVDIELHVELDHPSFYESGAPMVSQDCVPDWPRARYVKSGLQGTMSNSSISASKLRASVFPHISHTQSLNIIEIDNHRP